MRIGGETRDTQKKTERKRIHNATTSYASHFESRSPEIRLKQHTFSVSETHHTRGVKKINNSQVMKIC